MKERSSIFVTVLRKPGVDATWHTQMLRITLWRYLGNAKRIGNRYHCREWY